MNTVLVISDRKDSRVKDFADIFAGLGHELILASGNGITWCKVGPNGAFGPLLAHALRPDLATVLLVHRSDFKESRENLSKQLTKGWGKGFVFNSPGDPASIEGFIRILRPTKPFSLTAKHAQEICEFASDITGSKPLPTCCCVETEKQHLIALDILCQGYLVARNRTDLLGFKATQLPNWKAVPENIAQIVSEPEWWRRPFDGISLEDAIAAECGGTTPPELRPLLDNPGGKGKEAEEMIHAAHLKISELLKQ